MNTNVVVVSAMSFLVGTVAGFIVGRKFSEDHNIVTTTPIQQTQSEDKKEENYIPQTAKVESHVQVKAAQIATPEKPGINYTAYNKKVEELKYKATQESPTDGDSSEPSDPVDEDIQPEEETYEELLTREAEELNKAYADYTKMKGDRIEVLGKRPIDNDYPDIHYPEEYLTYIIGDDVLCDDTGKILDHNGESLIGNKLSQFGWFRNGEEFVWVRNHKLERDYKIEKVDTTYEEFFDNSNNVEV